MNNKIGFIKDTNALALINYDKNKRKLTNALYAAAYLARKLGITYNIIPNQEAINREYIIQQDGETINSKLGVVWFASVDAQGNVYQRKEEIL